MKREPSGHPRLQSPTTYFYSGLFLFASFLDSLYNILISTFFSQPQVSPFPFLPSFIQLNHYSLSLFPPLLIFCVYPSLTYLFTFLFFLSLSLSHSLYLFFSACSSLCSTSLSLYFHVFFYILSHLSKFICFPSFEQNLFKTITLTTHFILFLFFSLWFCSHFSFLPFSLFLSIILSFNSLFSLLFTQHRLFLLFFFFPQFQE